MNARERFRRACRCKSVDRPPVWIMRQAGRYLPEYRALREDHSFHDVVENPELACEVTMQPMRRFNLDAAIIFSDILVIPEAMGQPYGFPEGGGIEMDYAVRTSQDVDRLEPEGVADRLDHVGAALRRTRDELGDERALVGFAGAPWTLASYMVEGESSDDKIETKRLFYSEPDVFDELMERLCRALVEYLEMQIDAGVDAIQLFDSWAGTLAADAFDDASARWIGRVLDSLDADVPVVVFAKHASHRADTLVDAGADVVSVGWNVALRDVRDRLDGTAVQGNLDPSLLSTEPDIVERETRALLESMEETTGHIANLGHGILPSAEVDCVERFVETVRSFA